MNPTIQILKNLGWTQQKSSSQLKFVCPCPNGKHHIQVHKGTTPEELLRELRSSFCPSIKNLPEVTPWPKNEEPKCHFCKKKLPKNAYNRTWVYVDGVFACRHHPGVQELVTEQQHTATR